VQCVLVVEGRPETQDFDKSFYTEDHDVPALWIGNQIVDIGDGYSMNGGKSEEHLRWKLNPEKLYRVTIEEVT